MIYVSYYFRAQKEQQFSSAAFIKTVNSLSPYILYRIHRTSIHDPGHEIP